MTGIYIICQTRGKTHCIWWLPTKEQDMRWNKPLVEKIRLLINPWRILFFPTFEAEHDKEKHLAQTQKSISTSVYILVFSLGELESPFGGAMICFPLLILLIWCYSNANITYTHMYILHICKHIYKTYICLFCDYKHVHKNMYSPEITDSFLPCVWVCACEYIRVSI